MGRVPSSDILAKDVIGYAQELVSEDDARDLIQNLAIQYYNQAILEIYNIVLLINPTEYDNYTTMSSANSNLSTTSISDKIYEGDLSSTGFDDYDEIINMRCDNDDDLIECTEVNRAEFNTYFEAGEAGFPYEDSIIYSIREGSIDFCFGENIHPSTPTFTVRFRRIPTLLNSSNYDTLYMGVSDRYFPLLSNRIASFAEIKKGVKDNTLVIVKFLYEQMMSELNTEVQTRIKKMLKVGE